MATVIPEQVSSEKTFPLEDAEPGIDTKETETVSPVAPLGKPHEEKKFWFQRTKTKYDPDAIATQV